MNIDFRISVGLFTHPKFIKLCRKLGDSAGLSFIRLLSFAAQNRTDGDLSGMDTDDIAIAAMFTGDAEAFVTTLVAVRLLDQEGDCYAIHDWAEHNPYAAGAEARADSARHAANMRHGKPCDCSKCRQDAEGMPVQSSMHEEDMRIDAPRMRPAPIRNAPDRPDQTRPDLPIQTDQTDRPADMPGAESSSSTQMLIDRILRDNPHWVEPLKIRVEASKPAKTESFRLKILQNWLNGDGTPPKPVPKPTPSPPKPKLPLPEDWMPGVPEDEARSLTNQAWRTEQVLDGKIHPQDPRVRDGARRLYERLYPDKIPQWADQNAENDEATQEPPEQVKAVLAAVFGKNGHGQG